jgi:thiol-disulfide isomerase/thioredoxin
MKKIIIGLSIIASMSYAQTFYMKTVTGKTVTVKVVRQGFKFTGAGLTNKGVYLNFFGTHCPPCRSEIPRLKEDAKMKGYGILGIQAQMPESNRAVKSFKRDMNMNYPVVNINEANKLIDFLIENNRWQGSVPYTMEFASNGQLQ